MTIAPLTPAAAPVPTTGAAAGSNPESGDFLAAMLDALAAPVVETPDAGTPVPATPEATAPATPATPAAPEGAAQAPATPATPATPDEAPNRGNHLGQNKLEHPGLHLGLHHTAKPVNPKQLDQDAVPDEPVPPADPCPTVESAVAPAVSPDAASAVTPADAPADASTLAQTVAPAPVPAAAEAPTAPRLDRPAGLSRRPGTSEHPGLHLGADSAEVPSPPTESAATNAAAPARAEHPAVLPAGLTVAATAAAPVAAPALTSVPTTTAVPTTINAPTVSDQVFGEVTGLVSRGNGTHRITLNLQPEQLGDVRVVLTVRSGTVHVRLAAGQDARAALLEGSPELKQLLERAGATETRIEIRQLPAPAVTAVAPNTAASAPGHQHAGAFDQTGQQAPSQPATQTPATDTASTQLTGGDRSPDRHAGTRADHLATDGDDDPAGHRSGGRRDVTPIRQVNPHAAGLDLTM